MVGKVIQVYQKKDLITILYLREEERQLANCFRGYMLLLETSNDFFGGPTIMSVKIISTVISLNTFIG